MRVIEYVGLCVCASMCASDVPIVCETLPLRPHDEFDPDASDNVILDDDAARCWICCTLDVVRSLPVRARPSRDVLRIVDASSFDSINPAAANTLAVLGPSQSITGRALLDSDDAGRTYGVRAPPCWDDVVAEGVAWAADRCASRLILRFRLRSRPGRYRSMLGPRPTPASIREMSSRLARAWLSSRFAAVLPSEADPEVCPGAGVDGTVGGSVGECGAESMMGGVDTRDERMREGLLVAEV